MNAIANSPILAFRGYFAALSQSTIRGWCCAASFLAMLGMRPGILMEFNVELSIIATLFCSAAILMKLPDRISPSILMLICGGIALTLYGLFQAMILSLIPPGNALKWMVFVLLPTIWILSLDENGWKCCIKSITVLTAAFALSHAFTAITWSVGLFEPFRFRLFTVDVGDLIVPYGWYLPMSFVYYDQLTDVGGGISLFRLSGFMREPGLFQIFLVISFYAVDWLRWRGLLLWKALFVLSLALTLSTAGFAVFGFAWAYSELIAERPKGAKGMTTWLRVGLIVCFNIIFVAVILYLGFAGEGTFAFKAKLDSSSGEERLVRLEETFDLLRSHPLFGVGIQNTQLGYHINFIGAAGQLGIVGSSIWILLIAGAAFLGCLRRSPFAVIGIAACLTAIVAQPIYDTPLTITLIALSVFASDRVLNLPVTSRGIVSR